MDLHSKPENQNAKSSSPTKNENPWNLSCISQNNNSLDMNVITSNDNEESFHEIMNEDVKKRENLFKSQSKPLHATQIEEQAIEELKTFYNAHNSSDEIIMVSRVESGNIAVPLWKKSK